MIYPLSGYRLKSEWADKVLSVPYDVVTKKQAAEIMQEMPASFLHVVLPDLSPTQLPAGEALQQYVSAYYERIAKPTVFVYRISGQGHEQTGFFGCFSVDDYKNGRILRHELTRPDKEEGRIQLICEQQAHAEPVLMIYRDTEPLKSLIGIADEKPAEFEFEFQGLNHSFWALDLKTYEENALNQLTNLYIADGHHRTSAALHAKQRIGAQATKEASFFPGAAFPESQSKILAYNRVIKKSVSDAQWNSLKTSFHLGPSDQQAPTQKAEFKLYFRQKWWKGIFDTIQNDETSISLDVDYLQKQILEPVFGIENPRTDENIDFIGGFNSTDEIEKWIQNGEATMGFSLYPTQVSELLAVADSGGLMPPKSTWFEPKLSSGFFIHTF